MNGLKTDDDLLNKFVIFLFGFCRMRAALIEVEGYF